MSSRTAPRGGPGGDAVGRSRRWTASSACPRLALVPNVPMPTKLEEVLDAEWLSESLDDITEEDRIIGVEAVDSSKTLAQKVRFRVTVVGVDGQQRIRSYCVKGHLDGSPGNTLMSEARFYRELAPLLDVRTPRAYYAAVDATAGQAMIIMDDIVDMGGRFLSAHSPYSLDTTRGSLAQLARLHASTWGGARTAGLDWLSPRVGAMADVFPTELLQTLLNDGRGPEIASELRDPRNLVEALHRTADHEITCVIHGDTHSGNVYLDHEGHPSWLDWQIVQHGNWATDISYHLATVLDIETRRAHEGELLRHYLRELESHGIDVPGWDEAWEGYTLSFSYGYFLWVITQISSRAVVLIHIPRLAAALTDHDTFRRLGVV
jgi:aminoglycoside phosphotransferase (APT) family kinase protein